MNTRSLLLAEERLVLSALRDSSVLFYTFADPSTLREARAAVERLQARRNENVDEWAKNLASDLVAADKTS
jgi:hypothetical protein